MILGGVGGGVNKFERVQVWPHGDPLSMDRQTRLKTLLL